MASEWLPFSMSPKLLSCSMISAGLALHFILLISVLEAHWPATCRQAAACRRHLPDEASAASGWDRYHFVIGCAALLTSSSSLPT